MVKAADRWFYIKPGMRSGSLSGGGLEIGRGTGDVDGPMREAMAGGSRYLAIIQRCQLSGMPRQMDRAWEDECNAVKEHLDEWYTVVRVGVGLGGESY